MSNESDPFQKAYTDVTPWRNVSEYLDAARRALPETDWKPKFPTPAAAQAPESDKAAIRKTILATAKASALATGLALQHYEQRQRWSDMSPESAYYLRLMHDSVLAFVGRMGVRTPEGPRTIFPFPNATMREVASWLLVEWWTDNGLREYAMSQTAEGTLFFRYFS